MFKGNFPSVVLNKTEIYWDSKALGHVTFNLIKVLSLKECKKNLCQRRRLKIQWELFEFWPQVRESGLRNRRNCEIREIFPFGQIRNLWLWDSESNTAQGIRDLTDHGKSCIDKVRSPEPGILNPRRETQNPILSWINKLSIYIIYHLFLD